MKQLMWLGSLAAGLLLVLQINAAPSQSVQALQLTASTYQFEPSVIHVTAGEPVRLTIRSKDSVHRFSIPELRGPGQCRARAALTRVASNHGMNLPRIESFL